MTDRVFPPLAAVSIAESGARDSSGAESGMQLASPACAGAFSREAAFPRREEEGDNPANKMPGVIKFSAWRHKVF